MVKAERVGGRLEDVRGFIGGFHEPDLHAKQIDALAGATLWAMAGASLAVTMIGLAQARGLVAKHAVSRAIWRAALMRRRSRTVISWRARCRLP